MEDEHNQVLSELNELIKEMESMMATMQNIIDCDLSSINRRR